MYWCESERESLWMHCPYQWSVLSHAATVRGYSLSAHHYRYPHWRSIRYESHDSKSTSASTSTSTFALLWYDDMSPPSLDLLELELSIISFIQLSLWSLNACLDSLHICSIPVLLEGFLLSLSESFFMLMMLQLWHFVFHLIRPCPSCTIPPFPFFSWHLPS